MMARWIRLGVVEPADFEALYERLAAGQARAGAPALLWAQDDARFLFALVAPRRLAPGRVQRWASWGLAPVIATYRQFDLPAYFEGDVIWLHGRPIAQCAVREIGECAVVASSFLSHFPSKCIATPSSMLEEAFRLRLEAQHGWQFDHSWLGAKPFVDRPDLAADRA